MAPSRTNSPDPRGVPNHGIREAAHYLRLPVSTLRAWALGQGETFKPVFRIAERHPPALSFFNLVEGHVLGAIRVHVRMPKIRGVLGYVERELGVERPLVTQVFQTDGVDLFVDHCGRLLNVSQQGQIAMRDVLARYLSRLDFDASGRASRLYPLTRGGVDRGQPTADPRAVVFDPWVSFGRLVIAGTGITTVVVHERFQAGDTRDELARDFGIEAALVEEAIRCESLQRAA